MKKAYVRAVHKSPTHSFSKFTTDSIHLLKGLGVEGDAHQGKTVKHRSRVAKDPTQPNLRQVHLIHSELHQELQHKGFDIKAGKMGENITTTGIDLLNLPRNTLLQIGEKAVIEITGLRNPCAQLNNLQDGLMKALLDKDAAGNLIRKSGIMAIIKESGEVKEGDEIHITLPAQPHIPLDRV